MRSTGRSRRPAWPTCGRRWRAARSAPRVRRQRGRPTVEPIPTRSRVRSGASTAHSTSSTRLVDRPLRDAIDTPGRPARHRRDPRSRGAGPRRAGGRQDRGRPTSTSRRLPTRWSTCSPTSSRPRRDRPVDDPEPAVPIVEGAVEVVASIDFTAELAGPVTAAVGGALDAGPGRLLDALDGQIGELRRGRPVPAVGRHRRRARPAVRGPVGHAAEREPGCPARSGRQRAAAGRRSSAAARPVGRCWHRSRPSTRQLVALASVRPSKSLRPVDEAIPPPSSGCSTDGATTTASRRRPVAHRAGVDRRGRRDRGRGTPAGRAGRPARLADAALTELVEAIVGGLGTADISRCTTGSRRSATPCGRCATAPSRRTSRGPSGRRRWSRPCCVAPTWPPSLVRRARSRGRAGHQRPVPKRRRLVAATDRLVAVIDQLEAAAGRFGALSAEIDALPRACRPTSCTYSGSR